MFKKDVYILETSDSAAGMRKALPKLAKFATKLAKGEEILISKRRRIPPTWTSCKLLQ